MSSQLPQRAVRGEAGQRKPALRSIPSRENAAAEVPSGRTDDEEHFGEAGSIAVGLNRPRLTRALDVARHPGLLRLWT